MNVQSIRRALLVGAGVAAVASTRRRARQRAARSFYDATQPVVPAAGTMTTFPAVVHRAETFGGIFGARLDAVAALLPQGLFPVRLDDGRGAVLVQATRFHEVTDQHIDGPTLVARPYGEVTVAVLVTRRPAPPMLPLLPVAPPALSAGIFPVHMPLTSREARDPGLAMGLPKFIADLDFDDAVTSCAVRVAESGAEILELTIEVDGPMTPQARSQAWYHVFDGALHVTTARLHGYGRQRMGRGLGRLLLGTHPVAHALRSLGIEEAPVASLVFPSLRGLMSAPKRLGPAEAAKTYPGQDAQLGRYTVRHPHTDAVDQYGPIGLEASAMAQGLRLGPITPPEKAEPAEAVEPAGVLSA